jgi:hypothetical protein
MKQYLGDSVYVDVENGMVKLYTDNGYGETNVIYFESEVMAAFLQYLKRIKEEYDAKRGGPASPSVGGEDHAEGRS